MLILRDTARDKAHPISTLYYIILYYIILYIYIGQGGRDHRQGQGTPDFDTTMLLLLLFLLPLLLLLLLLLLFFCCCCCSSSASASASSPPRPRSPATRASGSPAMRPASRGTMRCLGLISSA